MPGAHRQRCWIGQTERGRERELERCVREMRGQADFLATLLGSGHYPYRFPIGSLIDVFKAARCEFPEVTVTKTKSLWRICIIHLDYMSHGSQTDYIH